MFTIMFLVMLFLGIINSNDTYFIASALFGIASTIESFTYKCFKRRGEQYGSMG